MPLDGRCDRCVVGLIVTLRKSVKGNRGLDPVGAQRCENERQESAHTETHDADAVADGRFVLDEVVDGAAHVTARAISGQRLHQLAGLVHLVVTSKFAVVEIRGQRDETRRGEAVSHLCDAGIETPPLLDDDHSGAGTALRHREIPACVVAVAGELDHFTAHPPNVQRSHCAKHSVTECQRSEGNPRSIVLWAGSGQRLVTTLPWV